VLYPYTLLYFRIRSARSFLPRDAILALHCCRRVSVRLPVRHEPVVHRNDRTNRAGFWRGGFPAPIPHCVVTKFGYLQKLTYFPLELCRKLRTKKSSQVNHVINKTRRRSSLLTTPIRQSTSRGCLLEVDER